MRLRQRDQPRVQGQPRLQSKKEEWEGGREKGREREKEKGRENWKERRERRNKGSKTAHFPCEGKIQGLQRLRHRWVWSTSQW